MDYEYNKTHKSGGGVAAACVAITMLVVIGLIVGVVALNNNMKASYNKQLADVETALDEKYTAQLDDMQSLITELQNSSATSSSVISTASTNSSATPQAVIDLTGSSTIAEIADAVKPSIVNITVTVPSTRYQSGFFSYNVGGVQATGTGIVLSEDGYISTNYHVVSYYDQYENVTIDVALSDGTEFAAEFIGGDENNDLAVIKIDPAGTKLTPAKFGRSDDLKVGEVVLAIGNPLGIEFAGSVTMGIVSALDRTVSAENSSETMIQTDAAINPGNSGGALVNIAGEVVGITTLKVSDTTVEGLGFAIPVDYATPIIENLIEYGYVKDRPATGISGETISKTTARYYNVPQGVLVTDVEENSGADLAGVKVNDIITEIDGKEILSMLDIQDVNASHKVGDVVEVTYYRNGEYETASLLLMEDRGR